MPTMTPRRQMPRGLDMPMMAGPQLPPMPAMQMAPIMPSEDASGAQAIGGLANMAGMLAQRMGGPGGQPTDAPQQRRKLPFNQAMESANYA